MEGKTQYRLHVQRQRANQSLYIYISKVYHLKVVCILHVVILGNKNLIYVVTRKFNCKLDDCNVRNCMVKRLSKKQN